MAQQVVLQIQLSKRSSLAVAGSLRLEAFRYPGSLAR